MFRTNRTKRTKEIRWFRMEPFQELSDWFKEESAERRVDHYLRVDGDNMSYKLREGKLELKIKTKTDSEYRYKEVKGFAQSWEKWSLKLREEAKSPGAVFSNSAGKFMIVRKSRQMIKVGVIDDKVIGYSGDGVVSDLCQVELTRISAGGKTFYSFGLETEGDDHEMIFNNVFQYLETKGKISLKKEDCFSYPDFLKSLL